MNLNEDSSSQLRSAWIEEAKQNAFVKERTIYIWEAIDDDTAFLVNRMMEKIIETDNPNQPLKPITIKINSPGGGIHPMLSIISKIEEAKDRGYEVITIGYGIAMSAGLFILLAGSKRKSQRYCRFLLHQIQSYGMGHSSVESTKREYQDLIELWDEVMEYVKSHSKITDELLGSITENDKDYYFFSNTALELGVIDEVL